MDKENEKKPNLSLGLGRSNSKNIINFKDKLEKLDKIDNSELSSPRITLVRLFDENKKFEEQTLMEEKNKNINSKEENKNE
jgi:hypothetical protein